MWVNGFWLSVGSLNAYIFILGINVVVVGNRVFGATVFAFRIILSASSWFSLFFLTGDTDFCIFLVF